MIFQWHLRNMYWVALLVFLHFTVDAEEGQKGAPTNACILLQAVKPTLIEIRIGDPVTKLSKIDTSIPFVAQDILYKEPMAIGTNWIKKFSINDLKCYYFLHDGSIVTNILYVPIHVVKRGLEKDGNGEHSCLGPLILPRPESVSE